MPRLAEIRTELFASAQAGSGIGQEGIIDLFKKDSLLQGLDSRTQEYAFLRDTIHDQMQTMADNKHVPVDSLFNRGMLGRYGLDTEHSAGVGAESVVDTSGGGTPVLTSQHHDWFQRILNRPDDTYKQAAENFLNASNQANGELTAANSSGDSARIIAAENSVNEATQNMIDFYDQVHEIIP